jgi:hypothetical protein
MPETFRRSRSPATVSPMLLPRFAFVALVASGCGFPSHRAEIKSSPLPPPSEPVIRHFSPIWLEIDPGVVPSQCVRPKGQRRLCFEDVHAALASALRQSLWTSFPDAPVLGPRDQPAPGDYRLIVQLRVEAVPPSEGGPGWAARGDGSFRLLRDAQTLTSAEVESRSRAEFAYGRPLGVGAGEVIDAIATQIASELGRVPETRPEPPRPLPAVQVASAAAQPRPTRRPAVTAQLEPYMASANSNVALSSSE